MNKVTRYTNYYLVVNQNQQPLIYGVDKKISLFYKKEHAEAWIKRRKKTDDKYKRKREIINVNLEVI
jgi:hypothetical protein